MSIGLDIGNTRWRSLRRQDYRLLGRNCRAAYIALPNTASRHRLLERLNVRYQIVADQLIVSGDNADDVSELFRVPVRTVSPNSPADAFTELTQQVIAEFAESLLPETAQQGEICCFTSAPFHEPGNAAQQQLIHCIRQRGYQPLGIGGATAIVLAELGNKALTGIGISFGSARCETALVRHGVELARHTVERGGDWIDHQLATRQSLFLWDRDGKKQVDVCAAQEWKESNAGTMLTPESALERQLAALYRELVGDVVGAIHKAFDSAPHVFDAVPPVTIVCAGGTASRPGFREVVLGELRKSPLPFAVEQVRVVRTWEYSPARGCLIRASLEDQTASLRAA